MKQKKKTSDVSTYEMDDDSSSNSYIDDSVDFGYRYSDRYEKGLNDDDEEEEDLYTDDAAAENRRKQDRAKVRARKKQAQQAPAVGGLEALFAQEAPPPRIKSIGIHGEQELEPVRRTRPTAPLRSRRSGGLLKVNRKVTRMVKDTGRGVVGAVTAVAEEVTRGREEGETFGERVRSSSLGAFSRKLTSRAERKQARKAADGGDNNERGRGRGMGELSLDDGPNEKKGNRGSSIGALARRGPRRNRWKSVDDAEDLVEGDLDLNDRSPSRTRGGSLGPISAKARRERWKSVDDKEDLLDADGEFELQLADSEKSPKMKERNSIGAINTRSKREDRKKQDSSGEMRVGRKAARSSSRDKPSKDDGGEKRPKRRGKKGTSKEVELSDDSSSDDDEKKTKRKLKKSGSKERKGSSHHDGEKKPKRKGKRSTSKDAALSDDDSSDDDGKVRKGKQKTRKKASKSPKPLKKKGSKKVDDDEPEGSSLELGAEGQTRGRGRVARRTSLGSSEQSNISQTADDVLRRTQAANARWDASKQESVIERRVRRRASLGAGESMRRFGQ